MEFIGNLVFETILIFLPAYIGNMMPVLVYAVPFLKPLFKYRIDFGFKLRGNDLFGKNKTWAGLISGILGGMISGYLIFLFFSYSNLGPDTREMFSLWIDILYGALLGFGALFGDLTKSFFKRRLNINPGKPWILFDQMDFILGAYLFSYLISPIPLNLLITALIITPLLHLSVNILAFELKLKKVWW